MVAGACLRTATATAATTSIAAVVIATAVYSLRGSFILFCCFLLFLGLFLGFFLGRPIHRVAIAIADFVTAAIAMSFTAISARHSAIANTANNTTRLQLRGERLKCCHRILLSRAQILVLVSLHKLVSLLLERSQEAVVGRCRLLALLGPLHHAARLRAPLLQSARRQLFSKRRVLRPRLRQLRVIGRHPRFPLALVGIKRDRLFASNVCIFLGPLAAAAAAVTCPHSLPSKIILFSHPSLKRPILLVLLIVRNRGRFVLL
mmetsp:Transcript_26322/g.52883  ORF Transcript_26322/g.52883 Transcript_26322/m.52883 type:complete len:261 (-) Transcript_26322:159-941(-)